MQNSQMNQLVSNKLFRKSDHGKHHQIYRKYRIFNFSVLATASRSTKKKIRRNERIKKRLVNV